MLEGFNAFKNSGLVLSQTYSDSVTATVLVQNIVQIGMLLYVDTKSMHEQHDGLHSTSLGALRTC